MTTTATQTLYPVTLTIEPNSDYDDLLTIEGAGSEGDVDSVRNDADTAWNVAITVEPSEDFEPYEAALRSAGFVALTDAELRAAGYDPHMLPGNAEVIVRRITPAS